MRRFAVLASLLACGHAGPPAPAAPPPAIAALAADTPATTVGGATFVVPAGWRLSTRGPATILDAPEPGSRIALVDVAGTDADAAVAAAWSAYQPGAARPLKLATAGADKNGWSQIKVYAYQTSPNERRQVTAIAARGPAAWTVVVLDVADAVAGKRSSQIDAVFDRLYPRGYTRESFAGVPAAVLDAPRIAALGKFVDDARQALGVPGVSIGVVQNGKVVFAGGFGVRELGGAQPVDADTLYMIASNTKAMTTLMLAKLVEQRKLSWESPVTGLLPSFKLGDAETTRHVRVKHLICACTGLPRQDYDWLWEFKDATPAKELATLATVQPTSKFGELYQYSNLLAGAAGFVGGHVVHPALELGAAYDQAMQALVFDPLGMTATTFDFARALRGNHAGAYATDVDGVAAPGVMAINYAMIPLRPAGGAWSNVRDVLRYVQMELGNGALPDGKRYIAAEPLLARRKAQVAIGASSSYGMGLIVDTTYGVPVVHHGGDMLGYHSDMLWLPDHGIGAVILTNGAAGGLIRDAFQRKLLEVVFDGRPEADAEIAASAKAYFEQLAAERKLMTVPAAPADASKLAARYTSLALGELIVRHVGAATVFDFGEWKTEVASRKNPDGSTSFVTIAPGMIGFQLVVGSGPRRTLILRDAQHEYVFTER